MNETLFYILIGCIALLFLLVFKPVRELVFKLAEVKSLWGLLWPPIAVVLMSHLIVLKNFLPRSFIYPTLDDRKTTNAED